MAGFDTVDEQSHFVSRVRSAATSRVSDDNKMVLRATVVGTPKSELREAEQSAAR